MTANAAFDADPQPTPVPRSSAADARDLHRGLPDDSRCRAQVARMSHEMRTPLNAVLALSQLMSHDGNLTERQRRYVRAIEESGRYLLALVEDIVDLAKAGAGTLELVDAPVHLDVILRFVEDLVRPKAAEKGLVLHCTAAFGSGRAVRVDHRRLCQVLLNLASNAVKFTDSGEVTVSAQFLHEQGDKTLVRFVVADTGIGIEPAHFGEIFIPFVQVGEGGRRAAGCGLGLAISQEIVALMGGQIRVESEPGRGSSFHFDLLLPLMPLARGEAKPDCPLTRQSDEPLLTRMVVSRP
jgi:signal transduction histidine kinase